MSEFPNRMLNSFPNQSVEIHLPSGRRVTTMATTNQAHFFPDLATWNQSLDSVSMISWLIGQKLATPRKLRLFAIAVARHFWEHIKSQETIWAIEKAEELVDDTATLQERQSIASKLAYDHELIVTSRQDQLGFGCLAWASDTVALCAARDLFSVEDNQPDKNKWITPPEKANVIREIFGNPHFPLDFLCDWKTETVQNVAVTAYSDARDLFSGEIDRDHLAILADAVEEAGATSEIPCPRNCYEVKGVRVFARSGKQWDKGNRLYQCDCKDGRALNPVLAHLRGCGPCFRGCHILDAILGRTDWKGE